ncbi:MAG: hypothetical protein ACJ8IR_04125 [Alphaproteobacteria bacterium]|jgi:hypothetical protein
MLDEFRALGGVADNVRLGYGPFGRGIFSIDATRPVSIRIPEDLLLPVEHGLIKNDAFTVSPDSPLSARGRAFLEGYEREYSWGPGRLEVEGFLSAMRELPEQVRELLARKLGCARFFNPITPQAVEKWFFGTRAINFRDRRVIMPIVEMANHGGSVDYDTSSGVALEGVFEGEVLVKYGRSIDPYYMFLNWMFPSQEPMAFSIKMNMTVGGREIWIDRDFEGESPPWVPKVSVHENRISLAYLLLGHRQFPRIPRGAFRRGMSNAGLESVDEAFEAIEHVNRERFLDLLDSLETLDLPAIQPLRTLARNQLRALSCYYGLRQV